MGLQQSIDSLRWAERRYYSSMVVVWARGVSVQVSDRLAIQFTWATPQPMRSVIGNEVTTIEFNFQRGLDGREWNSKGWCGW